MRSKYDFKINSEALKLELRRRKITAADFARRCGMTQPRMWQVMKEQGSRADNRTVVMALRMPEGAVWWRVKRETKSSRAKPRKECAVCGTQISRWNTVACSRRCAATLRKQRIRSAAESIVAVTSGASPAPDILMDNEQPSRRWWCRRYDECLGIASERNWPGFTCRRCPVRDEWVPRAHHLPVLRSSLAQFDDLETISHGESITHEEAARVKLPESALSYFAAERRKRAARASATR